MSKLDEGWASCQREMDTLLNLVQAKNAEEFAEKVNAHEHHDQIAKEWERVKQDLRMYAGGEEEFEALWHALETGQYDQWMETHNTLSRRIEEESAKLGELQRSQGAIDNEIFRLAGDDSMTSALQKKKNRSGTEIRPGRMADPHVHRRTFDPGPDHLRIGPPAADHENGQRISEGHDHGEILPSHGRQWKGYFHRRQYPCCEKRKIWSSGTGDQVFLAIRLAMALSFGEQIEPLPIVLDDIFVRFDENGSGKLSASLWNWGRNSKFSFSPATKEPCILQKKWGTKRGQENSSTCLQGRLNRWGVKALVEVGCIPDMDTLSA